jgi:hypothetical protein
MNMHTGGYTDTHYGDLISVLLFLAYPLVLKK